MRQGIGIPVFAICFGVFIVIASAWQWSIGEVFTKSGTMAIGSGWPFLIAEAGMGAYIVAKGIRGVRSNSWPPPPL